MKVQQPREHRKARSAAARQGWITRRRKAADQEIEDTRRLASDFVSQNANAKDKQTRAKVRLVRRIVATMNRYDRLAQAGVQW